MAKSASPTRASGKTPADEIAQNEAQNTLSPVEPDGDPVEGGLTGGATTRPEGVHMSMTPAFSRMRTDWNSPDRDVIVQMRSGADTKIRDQFGEIHDIMYEIYDIVRNKIVNTATGEVTTDPYGVPEWEKVPGTNSYYEDWTRLGYKEREMLLFKITTGIFRWSQRAADIWGEAMFARAQFEEAFAHGYEDIKSDKATIDDRTARARKLSAEYRFFSVYASLVSRKADAIVRAAELLGQRLKDVSAS